MTADAPRPVPASETRRPSHDDLERWNAALAAYPDRVEESARVWRHGYTLLLPGIGVIAAVLTAATPPAMDSSWRLAMSGLLVVALVAMTIALWQVLSIEGGDIGDVTRLSLRSIVDKYGSFSGYLRHRAEKNLAKLATSRRLAALSAVATLLALVVFLFEPCLPRP